MTQDTNTLKPCPFCGGSASTENHFGVRWWIQCDNLECGRTDGCEYPSPSEAIAAWNTRAPTQDSQPRACGEIGGCCNKECEVCYAPDPAPTQDSQQAELTELHWHEMLDRAGQMQHFFATSIADHFCAPHMEKEIEAAADALGALYQAIGIKRFDVAPEQAGSVQEPSQNAPDRLKTARKKF